MQKIEYEAREEIDNFYKKEERKIKKQRGEEDK